MGSYKMNKSEFRKKILAAIEKTQQAIEELREMAAPVSPDSAIGRISRMDAINNKAVTEASLRNAEKKMEGLKYALQNLHSDEFGFCAKCHAPIPEARILLMPHSRFCVKCSV